MLDMCRYDSDGRYDSKSVSVLFWNVVGGSIT